MGWACRLNPKRKIAVKRRIRSGAFEYCFLPIRSSFRRSQICCNDTADLQTSSKLGRKSMNRFWGSFRIEIMTEYSPMPCQEWAGKEGFVLGGLFERVQGLKEDGLLLLNCSIEKKSRGKQV